MIAGTVAVKDPSVVAAMLDRFGPDQIIVGIDARDGIVKVSGWEEGSGVDAIVLGQAMRALGIVSCVFTDISKDGMLQGPNLAATTAFAEATGLQTIVSGGISSLEDLRVAHAANHPGLEGVIVGKALFDNRFEAPDAAKILHGEHS